MPLLRFRYGAHLSKEQVAELVRPDPYTLELVSSWLAHHGVRSSSISTTHGGAWLTVTDVLVSQANQLLGASYQLYRHAKTKDTTIRTVGYALPAVLHTHIQAVAPTTYFPTRVQRQTPRRRSFGAAAAQAETASGKLVTVLQSRDVDVTPDYLRRLYKTVAYVPAAADRNRLGVLGFENEYPNQADLTRFMAHFRSDAVAATFTVEQVNNGGNDLNEPGTEAAIDLQYAEAMAYPTPHIYYSIGGDMVWSPEDEPTAGDMYLEWFKHILVQSNIPQTISVSYGGSEEYLPPQYAVALCNMFAQLGARGVSVLFPSGDSGVGPGDCEDDEGDIRFIPEFPASCTCGVLFPLASTTQAQVQVAHQTAMVSQVPGSLASAALPAPTRSRRSSLEAASRTTFHARNTRTKRCPNSSSTSVTSILASTSALASVT